MNRIINKFLFYFLVGFMCQVAPISYNPAFGTGTDEPKVIELREKLFPYVFPKGRIESRIKNELQEYSKEELIRMHSYAKIFLTETQKGNYRNKIKNKIKTFAYTVFLENILKTIPPDSDNDFITVFSKMNIVDRSLEQIKNAIKKIRNEGTFMQDAAVFKLNKEGYTLKYFSAYHWKNLPKNFINDAGIDVADWAPRQPSPTFLIVNSKNEIVGYRPFRVSLNKVEGLLLVLKKSERGKGLGHKSFQEITRLWTIDPFLKLRTKIAYIGSTAGGKALINRFIKGGLTPETKSFDSEKQMHVTFKMKDVQKFLSSSK